ncbi:MAG: hypothetical protein E6G91_03140 [Alphaproteobacteria bacterium]|jgi:hypothetical protein|nr:MAG: hypothetical protein E6G91_03140 [Alphaproteobacteria bacterium]
MLHEAPQVLIALEQSGLAAAIRQSVWAYPAANVGHIVALTLFAGSVAIMDARLLGAFAAAPPADVVRPARRAAMLGLLLMAVTGSVLFTAEASHVAMNPVFQIKAALIALGLLNALFAGRALDAVLADTPARVPLPTRVRLSALLSLMIWISVAACGRLIAYF